MEKFPAKIRAARERLGRTQRDLAEDLGTAQPRVSDWEDGKRVPNLKWILRIARALDVTADFLLDDALDAPPPRTEINDEERKVLYAFRISGLDAREAGEAMVGVYRRGVGAREPSDFRPIGQTQDLTESTLKRLREKERAARDAARKKDQEKRRGRKPDEGGGGVPKRR